MQCSLHLQSNFPAHNTGAITRILYWRNKSLLYPIVIVFTYALPIRGGDLCCYSAVTGGKRLGRGSPWIDSLLLPLWLASSNLPIMRSYVQPDWPGSRAIGSVMQQRVKIKSEANFTFPCLLSSLLLIHNRGNWACIMALYIMLGRRDKCKFRGLTELEIEPITSRMGSPRSYQLGCSGPELIKETV